jgi:hypothetical protein
MKGKHARVLVAILEDSITAGIKWKDVEGLLGALGASIAEGNGSRIRVKLRGVRAVFHRPHPEKEAGYGRIRDVKAFLEKAGVTSHDI